jgi:aspartate aminotransferase
MADQLRERGITTATDMCERLLEDTGVAVLAGAAFGRPDSEFTARIAYVNFDGAAALDAVAGLPASEELDDTFLRAYCGQTLEAIDRLCDWMSVR